MAYQHTQTGYLHLVLLVLGLSALGLAATVGPGPALPVALVGGVFLLLAASFAQLTTRADVSGLSVGFGPLPLFRTRVDYGRIRSVRRVHSAWFDGLGIHWLPGRGWIWNVRFGDCVELDLDRGRLRVGTDDAEGLLACLRERLGQRA